MIHTGSVAQMRKDCSEVGLTPDEVEGMILSEHDRGCCHDCSEYLSVYHCSSDMHILIQRVMCITYIIKIYFILLPSALL